jgi:fumarylacetoacetate (FAA) hydrolase
MRLATRRNGSRDGELVVVAHSGDRCTSAREIVPNLQAALDDWSRVEPSLRSLSEELATGRSKAEPLATRDLLSPLPRAYEWVDGSAFLSHVRLVRRARGVTPPPTLETDPLVYQGGSGRLMSANEDFVLGNPAYGLDFEGEVAAVLSDVPEGLRAADAADRILLLALVNDWTLRELVAPELAKGFGFFNSKPASSLSPFVVTPDELGPAYRGGRIHLPLIVRLNGEIVGDPDAGAMHFSFFELIEHIAKTRAFVAGTLLGSGTVSNDDPARGVSCLAERRAREMLEHGVARTPFLSDGDQIEIAMLDANGWNVFGTLSSRVVCP